MLPCNSILVTLSSLEPYPASSIIFSGSGAESGSVAARVRCLWLGKSAYAAPNGSSVSGSSALSGSGVSSYVAPSGSGSVTVTEIATISKENVPPTSTHAMTLETSSTENVPTLLIRPHA